MPEETKISRTECDFCGTSASGAEAKHRYVAGPRVFVCRDCVGMMVEIFTQFDAEWGEQRIRDIKEAQSKPRS
jgi:ribosome-binding protein aMBF1 (putative translation factor)